MSSLYVRFNVIPSRITLSSVNLKFNCILDRHVPLSSASLPRWSVTIYLVLEISPQESRIGSNTFLFSLIHLSPLPLFSLFFPRSIDVVSLFLLRNRVKYEKNGTTKRKCSRENLRGMVCSMKFTLTRTIEIKFARDRGNSGLRRNRSSGWGGTFSNWWMCAKTQDQIKSGKLSSLTASTPYLMTSR